MPEENITLSAARIRQAAANCPQANATLRMLFPEVFAAEDKPAFVHDAYVVQHGALWLSADYKRYFASRFPPLLRAYAKQFLVVWQNDLPVVVVFSTSLDGVNGWSYSSWADFNARWKVAP